MTSKGFKVLLSAFLLFVWFCILYITLIFAVVSDVFKSFENGVLKYIFAIVYLSAFVLPIIFRKKLKGFCSLHFAMIIAAFMSVMINFFVYSGISTYVSDFSREKWDKYENLRIHMIDDFENEHQIEGKSEKEIVELIGNPTYISDDGKCYEYYVGDSMIDPYTYDVIFEEGIVKQTRIVEH